VCVCVCVCVCVRARAHALACFYTVCSLYVLTDGSSLIFYPVSQKIKLKLDDTLLLQFRVKKI
jgi:hypothetical protein